VKLLIKHGVDVNKCVVGAFNISEHNRTKKGKRKKTRTKSEKQFNPQNGNPESKETTFFALLSNNFFFRSCLLR
jgi:hypothetical protein